MEEHLFFCVGKLYIFCYDLYVVLINIYLLDLRLVKFSQSFDNSLNSERKSDTVENTSHFGRNVSIFHFLPFQVVTWKIDRLKIAFGGLDMKYIVCTANWIQRHLNSFPEVWVPHRY